MRVRFAQPESLLLQVHLCYVGERNTAFQLHLAISFGSGPDIKIEL